MATAPTSLKLPSTLKNRLDKLAAKSGTSTHAFMVSALEDLAARMELADQFLQDAIEADENMLKSGKGYAAAAVHDYALARASGQKATRPRKVSWRKSSTPKKP